MKNNQSLIHRLLIIFGAVIALTGFALLTVVP